MKCDSCRKEMTPGETLITWDESDAGVVSRMAFTHRGDCDALGLFSSAGAAYGLDWEPEHERKGVAQKPFKNPEQKSRLIALLNAQAVARVSAANA